MAKASIHFRPVKENSESHNLRKVKLDYNFPDLSTNNESWMSDQVSTRRATIAAQVKELTGRKLQKKATPIREAVVNLNEHHSMADLQQLAREIERKKKIKCFQIFIHRDEGKSRQDLNYHAHLVFDWMDHSTGRSFKLKRADMSEVQDIVAEQLGMERGELRENSHRHRLEAVEFKRQARAAEVRELVDQVKILEQKKNQALENNEKARSKHREDLRQVRAAHEAHKRALRDFLKTGDPSSFPNEIVAHSTSKWLEKLVAKQRQELAELQGK